LHAVLRRVVQRVLICTAWGEQQAFASPSDARDALARIDTSAPRGRFLRYELRVKYSNGDSIDAQFETASDASEFLDRLK
jgi:hypothetical protein